jgi:3-mercaptopyruvate sulfurtransferase SseA
LCDVTKGAKLDHGCRAQRRDGIDESARYTAEHIPGARFFGFETGGHLVLGRQREIEIAVQEFAGK